MAVRTNFNPSGAAKPTNVLLNDLRLLHNEMAEAFVNFNALCERLEQCANALREINLVNNRAMFQNFFDRGIAPGKLVRFVDTPANNVIYEVTGMDGEGFFLQRFPNGQEFKLRVLEDNHRCRAMRLMRENSQMVKKALAENNLNESALPSRRMKAKAQNDYGGEYPDEESYFEAINSREMIFSRNDGEDEREDFSDETMQRAIDGENAGR